MTRTTHTTAATRADANLRRAWFEAFASEAYRDDFYGFDPETPGTLIADALTRWEGDGGRS
jgi:hypothetical protein